MIGAYESDSRSSKLDSPRIYGLNLNHKHIPEIMGICRLDTKPIFIPVVADYFSGMLVTVPLFKSDLQNGKTAEDIKALYKEKYNTPIVRFQDSMDEAGFLSANAKSETDSMDITVCGNDERILLLARYDNLGKGASGAALECMNIKMGLPAEFNLEI